ncbi:MAG TPA: hypothetical protein VHZ50_18625, partial [Puia sp.]|nr:hypothetical protein [Puia sp.]
LEYDCELNYAFHSTYRRIKDTIVVKGKDDSHSEDGGKITSYWITKYLIKDKSLFVLNIKELVNGKWVDRKIKRSANPFYIRVK